MDLTRQLRDTAAWRAYRRTGLERFYRQRSADYQRLLANDARAYSEAAVERQISQGRVPQGKQLGEVRTFLLVPDIAWHATLLPTFEKLGPVTWYRFEGDRCWWRRRPTARKWIQLREEVNLEIRECVREACKAGGIDWVFCYTEGRHLLRDTVRYFREGLGLPSVMMCLDDKQSWELGRWGSQDIGQVDLAAEFDLYWTSARECCKWILAEGGRPIFMPEGCDPELFRPMEVRKDLDVCFVGTAYGFRKSFTRRIARRLSEQGYSVGCFGPGWRSSGPGVWGEELVRTLNRGWINLGHGGIGDSENLLNVKTRDFEAPAIGTAAYLTTFNPDLAPSFEIGQEICCYRSDDDLVEQAVALLSDKERLLEIARRGRRRCVRDHTWLQRFVRVLRLLRLMDSHTALGASLRAHACRPKEGVLAAD